MITETIFGQVLICFFIILAIISLRKVVRVAPSVVSSLLRWKEIINLEDSVKLSIDRNAAAVLFSVPFCMAAARYRLYSPAFTEGLAPVPYFLTVLGVFLLYNGLRALMHIAFRPKKMNVKLYKTSFKSSYTFFIMAAFVFLSTAGICAFADVPDAVIKTAGLYETGAVYLLYLFRKGQIFMKSCSFLMTILYLCTLEILPTCILVASVLWL